MPARVVKRILDLEFVEMAELSTDDDLPQRPGCPAPARLPVTSISQWVEKYSLMAAVLSTHFPEKAAELFAYQATIVRAERNYEGSRWVIYDRQFRREALVRKDQNWSIADPRLYNEAFTGPLPGVDTACRTTTVQLPVLGTPTARSWAGSPTCPPGLQQCRFHSSQSLGQAKKSAVVIMTTSANSTLASIGMHAWRVVGHILSGTASEVLQGPGVALQSASRGQGPPGPPLLSNGCQTPSEPHLTRCLEMNHCLCCCIIDFSLIMFICSCYYWLGCHDCILVLRQSLHMHEGMKGSRGR